MSGTGGRRPVGALVVAALALVAGCRGPDRDPAPAGDDGAGPTSTTVADAEGTDRGTASVTLDGETLDFALSTCVADGDRLTFQGGDGTGRTLVGTFSARAGNGSLTVTAEDGAWVAGAAGNGTFSALDVGVDAVRGSADFAVQAYGEVDPETGVRPVNDSGTTVPGSFEATCHTTTEPPG